MSWRKDRSARAYLRTRGFASELHSHRQLRTGSLVPDPAAQVLGTTCTDPKRAFFLENLAGGEAATPQYVAEACTERPLRDVGAVCIVSAVCIRHAIIAQDPLLNLVSVPAILSLSGKRRGPGLTRRKSSALKLEIKILTVNQDLRSSSDFWST